LKAKLDPQRQKAQIVGANSVRPQRKIGVNYGRTLFAPTKYGSVFVRFDDGFEMWLKYSSKGGF